MCIVFVCVCVNAYCKCVWLCSCMRACVLLYERIQNMYIYYIMKRAGLQLSSGIQNHRKNIAEICLIVFQTTRSELLDRSLIVNRSSFNSSSRSNSNNNNNKHNSYYKNIILFFKQIPIAIPQSHHLSGEFPLSIGIDWMVLHV